ncbi:hypothetical protein IQ07DRAFT_666600 [Pyrenochaeta sp. DS3sAY3a]|nr:hypothetical protein IQ07DRAFT_666600 [Pyrenochaeta sp. DS3sAY3a]
MAALLAALYTTLIVLDSPLLPAGRLHCSQHLCPAPTSQPDLMPTVCALTSVPTAAGSTKGPASPNAASMPDVPGERLWPRANHLHSLAPPLVSSGGFVALASVQVGSRHHSNQILERAAPASKHSSEAKTQDPLPICAAAVRPHATRYGDIDSLIVAAATLETCIYRSHVAPRPPAGKGRRTL